MYIPTHQELFDNCTHVQSDTLTGTNEFVVLANAILQIPLSTEVVFNGVIYLTPGADQTGLILRIREGYGTNGNIVFEPLNLSNPLAVQGGKAVAVPVVGAITGDLYQAPGGGQYCVTLQQLGGTADGQVHAGSVAWFNTTFMH